MDSFISKFFRQSSHYALGELLIFAAGFISFPILTRALTLSDYGVMSVYSATLWIFMAFSRAGLSEASVRFFPEYGSKDDPVRRATFFSSLFTGTVGIVIPLVLVILLFGERLFTLLFDKPMPYLHLLLAGQILANTLYTRTQSFWRAEQRSRDYTLALVISRYFILLISLAFLFFVSKTLISFFVGTLIAELLIALFLVILFFRKPSPLSSSSPVRSSGNACSSGFLWWVMNSAIWRSSPPTGTSCSSCWAPNPSASFRSPPIWRIIQRS